MDTSPSDRPSNEIVLKQSDFSIDHILNKAGAKYTYTYCTYIHNDVRDQCGTQNEHNEFKAFVPMLNWLQYTRYRPPKLPSKYDKRSIQRGLKITLALSRG